MTKATKATKGKGKNSRAPAAGDAVSVPKRAEAGVPVAARSEAVEAAASTITLLGSSVLAAEIDLLVGRPAIPLGDLVQEAHKASKLSVEAWNALPDEEREALIVKTIDELREVAADVAAAEAAAAAAKKNSDPPRMRAVLVVKARQDRRRRAGLVFGRTEVELNAAELTEAQIAAIEADHVLISSRQERPETN